MEIEDTHTKKIDGVIVLIFMEDNKKIDSRVLEHEKKEHLGQEKTINSQQV